MPRHRGLVFFSAGQSALGITRHGHPYSIHFEQEESPGLRHHRSAFASGRISGAAYKPKDAIERVLEEILLEHRYAPKKTEQTRADAEDFLSALRRGL